AFARDLGSELRRHLAMHLGKVDAGLLENAAFNQDARAPAPSSKALPDVLAEAAPLVQFFQSCANAILEGAKECCRLSEQLGWTCHGGDAVGDWRTALQSRPS